MLSTRNRARGIFTDSAATIAGNPHDLEHVGDGQPELAVGGRRIERASVDRLIEVAQRAVPPGAGRGPRPTSPPAP